MTKYFTRLLKTTICVFVMVISQVSICALAEPVNGDSTIRGLAGNSYIVIKTSTRTAGAVYSLTWNGKEFLDSYDHGRELQSALNCDSGSPITAETYNPTEAGSRRDGPGPKTSSKLLSIKVNGNELTTQTLMAFWLDPSEKSGDNPAKNKTILSNHLLTKHVVIGYKTLPNVISYDVTFAIPHDEHEQHKQAVFEALTGYMPSEFSRFLSFSPKSGTLEPLSGGPGEVNFPVVLSVPNGLYAMGIYAPSQRGSGITGPSFGRFSFDWAKVVKWNCVFRAIENSGVPSGEYSFRMFVVVGDLETVRHSLQSLECER